MRRIVLVAASLLAAAAAQALPLAGPHRRFLADVAPILSDYERAAFLAIESERGRDDFARAFWQARGDRRRRHEERLERVLRDLGEAARRDPGEARVRLYAQLGAPLERRRFPAGQGLADLELWSYRLEGLSGLESHLQLILFRPVGTAGWRIYHPLEDGPQALVAGVEAPAQALERLGMASADLADAALSPLPRLVAPGPPPLPARETAEVIERLRALHDRIDFDPGYVARHAPCTPSARHCALALRGRFHGAFDPEGEGVLHYGVEVAPDHLGLRAEGGRLRGSLQVSGAVFAAGRAEPVLVIDETAEPSLEAGRYRDLREHPLAFEDRVALLPGAYRVVLVVRDRVNQRFGVVAGSFAVPARRPGALALAPILLAAPAPFVGRERSQPFVLAGRACHPSARLPPRDEPLFAIVQVAYPEAALAPGAVLPVSYELHAGRDELMRAFDRLVLDAARDRGVAALALALPVAGLEPREYGLTLQVGEGAGAVGGETSFTIAADAREVTPWVVRRRAEGAASAGALALAAQLLARGADRAARDWLERAVQLGAGADARLLLAEQALRQGRAGEAAELAAAVEGVEARLLMARARLVLGDGEGAVAACLRALERAPESHRVLDLLVEARKRARTAAARR